MSENRVTLRFDTFRSFLDECSQRISEDGIFLATDDVHPVGTRVDFDLGLGSDFPLLRGSGEVVWVVKPNGEGAVPGMALRYETTDDATAVLVRKIAERARSETGSSFELSQAESLEPLAEAEPAAPEAAEETVAEETVAAEPGAKEPVAEEIEQVAEEAAATAPERTAMPAPSAAMPSYLEGAVGKAGGTAKRGRAGLWTAAALIAVLAGLAFWQRDSLVEKLGGGGAPPAAERVTDVSEPPAVESVEAEAADAVEQVPVEPEIAVAEPAPPAELLSRIEEVRWVTTGEGTLLELVADGAFPSDSYGIDRLEDPPRLLLKINGVTAPLATPTMAVGSEEVVGVRTALHGTPPSSALHVVVDLADPTAQLTASEDNGSLLTLRIASSAISP